MERYNTGSSFGKMIMTLIMMSLIFGAIAIVPASADGASYNRLRADKKLSSKDSAAFVKKMTVEMDIVLYPIISLPHAQAWREDMMKRFGARGSMKRKTRKQIAGFFKEDAAIAFTDAEIRDQIIAAVDRLLESEPPSK